MTMVMTLVQSELEGSSDGKQRVSSAIRSVTAWADPRDATVHVAGREAM